MIETLLSKPYRVIDILPERVPAGGPGQYFAVEKYWLEPARLAGLYRRFTDILLKLNCYVDFQVYLAEDDRPVFNPAPEQLASRIISEKKDLLILLPEENALITLNRGDLYMTVYNPTESLLKRLESLASAEGLFLREPAGRDDA